MYPHHYPDRRGTRASSWFCSSGVLLSDILLRRWPQGGFSASAIGGIAQRPYLVDQAKPNRINRAQLLHPSLTHLHPQAERLPDKGPLSIVAVAKGGPAAMSPTASTPKTKASHPIPVARATPRGALELQREFSIRFIRVKVFLEQRQHSLAGPHILCHNRVSVRNRVDRPVMKRVRKG